MNSHLRFAATNRRLATVPDNPRLTVPPAARWYEEISTRSIHHAFK